MSGLQTTLIAIFDALAWLLIVFHQTWTWHKRCHTSWKAELGTWWIWPAWGVPILLIFLISTHS